MDLYDTYIRNPLVDENAFRSMPRDEGDLPSLEQVRDGLPAPFWEGHETAIGCYWRTWELALGNLRRPTPASGFVANYIDTAFNDHLFMWDSAFILLFACYACRYFDFQRTLDNLYAKQHPDGFICREIREADGQDRFHRFDPASTGPNIMPWTEWEYYCFSGDRHRLGQVFPVLVAYHRWLRTYRTWPDGTYWASGWASGMDNQPRMPKEQPPEFYHGHLGWVDTCLQQILSARMLLRMADLVARTAEMADFRQELTRLVSLVNGQMWDEGSGFYHDRMPGGALSTVKTIGAYWALLAEAVPETRLARFIGHLRDPAEFNRPHRIPSLAADHPAYKEDGGYWLGGVWPPTNYMVLRGLSQAGDEDLAHEIALNHLGNVVQVFEKTGTVWENYAPETVSPGNPAKPDFVGWSGLAPVAVLLELAFGLRPDGRNSRLVWDVRLTDRHGVARYPLGKLGLLDLACARRSSVEEKPTIEATANIPVELEIRWAGGAEAIRLEPK